MRTLDARILRMLGKDEQKEDEQPRSCCASVFGLACISRSDLADLVEETDADPGRQNVFLSDGRVQLIYPALGPKRV